MPQLEAGCQLGAYHLISLLGRGGFAQVWEARNRDTGRLVALKVLTQIRAESLRALERFQQEGRLAASISHPRCVYVYAAEELEGLPVISMELMAGGTLANRLAQGPVPLRQAVDYVLDVIEGLEVAQRAGIIHRDIKPGNCFLDGAGRVKIGDFGISKSLELDSTLSVTGSFVGTPYYASPEQLSSEPLDFRSDLYSVGVLLYELLAGRTPFAGGNPGQVIASVLLKPPPPLAEQAVVVPARLQRVLNRLLAKKKEKRFQSYRAVREALLGYSSRRPEPAPPLRRFGAWLLDVFLMGLAANLLGVEDGGRTLSPADLALLLLIEMAYFALSEGLFGRSIGKRLSGLRVVGAGGEPVTFGGALARAALFVLFTGVDDLLAKLLILLGLLGPTGFPAPVAVALGWVVRGIVFGTMRRGNGFAGLHELLTRTRVVAVAQSVEPASLGPVAAPTAPELQESWACAPFRLVREVWQLDQQTLFLARDDELERDVWIHRYADPGAAPPLDRLLGQHAGDIPWLRRGQSEGFYWDAYGAPDGIVLARWVSERGRLSWEKLRGVLLSLAKILEERSVTALEPISVGRMWVDTSGNVLLLPFASDPGVAPGSSLVTQRSDDWTTVLRQTASFGLEGTAGSGLALPRVPLPGHARALLTRLFVSPPVFSSPGEFRIALEKDWAHPARLTPERRHASLVPSGLFLILVLLTRVLRFMEPGWSHDLSNAPDYLLMSREAEQQPSPDSASLQTIRSVGVVLSAAYTRAGQAPEGRKKLSALPDSTRLALGSLALRYPNPAPRDVTQAQRWLGSLRAIPSDPWSDPPPGRRFSSAGYSLGHFMEWASYTGWPAALAWLFRGSLLLSLFGLSIRRLDGLPAERWRCALRSLVVWSPIIAMSALRWVDPPGLALIPPLLGLVGTFWSAFSPARGPADLVAGTVLVPR